LSQFNQSPQSPQFAQSTQSPESHRSDQSAPSTQFPRPPESLIQAQQPGAPDSHQLLKPPSPIDRVQSSRIDDADYGTLSLGSSPQFGSLELISKWPIFPQPPLGTGASWTMTNLLVFLLEFGKHWSIHDEARAYSAFGKRPPYVQFTFEHDKGEKYTAVRIAVPEKGSRIRVDATSDWLGRKWTRKDLPSRGARVQTGRLTTWLKQPKQISFHKSKILKLGVSKCLVNGVPVTELALQSLPNAFVQVVIFLAKMAARMRLPKSQFTIGLSRSILSGRETVRYDFSKFKQFGGRFRLALQPRHPHDKMQPFRIDETEFSIIGGCYIHRFASSILINRAQNKIAGLMMDTTWSVMSQYVTAFMVAVAYNTAIPLGFAFGPIETHNLYKNFYTMFKDRFQIDLSSFIIESDQGSGLKKFCDTYQILQRICLKHFLTTLNDHVFGVYVSYLVKAVSHDEFSALCEAYCVPLTEALQRTEHKKGLKRATKEFAKAGLAFLYNGNQVQTIFIENQQRWNQVCTYQRITECMPSTTNALESFNGHCNSLIPRNNEFYHSICRLACQIEHGILKWSTAVQHNFNHATRRAETLARAIGEDELTQQKTFYETHISHCKCGQTSHYSAMYERDVPCCHRLSVGVARPTMRDPPTLAYSVNPPDFELEIKHYEREREPPKEARKIYLIEMAAQNIKRFTHTREKIKTIETWLKDHFPATNEMTTFIQKIPTSVIILIARGVTEFGSGITPELIVGSEANQTV
jgi:hypothetical protein